jgi:hypothetical protein
MKKLKLILLALVLFTGTLSTYAANDPHVSSNKTTKEIAKILENPDFEFEESIYAYVTFIVNKNNEVVVLFVDCETKGVCKFIKNRLNYRQLGTELEKGVEYKVPIRIVNEV